MTKSVDDVHCIDSGYLNAKQKLKNADIGKENKELIENFSIALRREGAADEGNCQVCMWILERRFPEDFARRQYRKTNIVSDKPNVVVDIAINDADAIRAKILEKVAFGRES